MPVGMQGRLESWRKPRLGAPPDLRAVEKLGQFLRETSPQVENILNMRVPDLVPHLFLLLLRELELVACV